MTFFGRRKKKGEEEGVAEDYQDIQQFVNIDKGFSEIPGDFTTASCKNCENCENLKIWKDQLKALAKKFGVPEQNITQATSSSESDITIVDELRRAIHAHRGTEPDLVRLQQAVQQRSSRRHYRRVAPRTKPKRKVVKRKVYRNPKTGARYHLRKSKVTGRMYKQYLPRK